MSKLTNKEFWSDRESEGEVRNFLFDNLFEKHLDKERGVALEIGCVPGEFLAYICELPTG